jgi:hypothetical protein
VLLLEYTNSSSDAKECQPAFLAPLPGIYSISILGSDVKKCQHAFLAPLPGKTLVKKNIVGHDHGNMHVW